MKLGFFRCCGSYGEGSTRSVLVLEPTEVPTTSFYVRSRIPKGVKSLRFNSVGKPPSDFSVEDGTWVIIVRHASRKWLRTLLKHKKKLVKVSYLKDDDISAVLTATELPLHYALWTAWRYFSTKDLLSKLVSDVVVSTQELAERYPIVKPDVWEPHYNDSSENGFTMMELELGVWVPHFHDDSEKPDKALVYFYHATLTHAREMKWLVPVVRRVQKALPNAWFEIIGDGSVARLFRGIPRVRCVHPMSWPNYQAYLKSIRYDVGIAPLIDSSFNRARSHTKLYQITRAGAAGIYSDVVPYSKKIIDGKTGILCPNRRYLWVKALVSLLKNASRRKEIYQNAHIWCDELQQKDCANSSSSGRDNDSKFRNSREEIIPEQVNVDV